MGAGLDIGMQLALACKGLPGNPYEDCVAQCDNLDVDKGKTKTKLDKKILKKERDICIVEQGCNDKDNFGNPIFENKNLKEECQQNLLDQVDFKSTEMSLMQDVTVGVSETLAREYLESQSKVVKEAKAAAKAAKVDTKSAKAAKAGKSGKSMGARAVKGVKTGASVVKSGITTIGGRIVATQTAKVIGKSAIAAGTKLAMSLFIRGAIRAGLVIKSALVKINMMLGRFLIRSGLKSAGGLVANNISKMLASTAAKQSLLILSKVICVATSVLSIIDGAAIILGLWDPGGWEMTINKGMIKSTRDSYYRNYLKYYDNKALFSESQVVLKNIAEKKYDTLLKQYEKNKTPENKTKMEAALKEYDQATTLMYAYQWKGSERPKEHGGALIYPSLAYPDFPYNENGDWLDPQLEEEYYFQIDQYMKKNNLVWTEEELKQEEYKAEIDQLNKKLEETIKKEDPLLKKIENKKSGNVSQKEIKIIEENIKQDEKNIKIIDNSIKELTTTIKNQEESGRIDKIPELQEKLDKLQKNKEKIEKKKQKKNKLLENIEKNKNNGATIEQKIKQNKAMRKGIGHIFVFLIIGLIGFFVYIKRKNISNSSQFKTVNSYFNPDIASNFQRQLNQQPNYQQPNYQQPNYQQPNYQQPNYQQPNYQQNR